LAVVRIQVISNIAKNYESIDFFSSSGMKHHVIDRRIFVKICLNFGPISKHNIFEGSTFLQRICQKSLHITRKRNGVYSWTVPAKGIVVECFLIFDLVSLALMYICYVVVGFSRKFKRGCCALNFDNSCFCNQLSIRSLARADSVEVYHHFLLRWCIFNLLAVKDAGAEGLTGFEGNARAG
jgi:hypothetical protein